MKFWRIDQEKPKGANVSSFSLRLTANTIIVLFMLKVYFFFASQNQMHFLYLVSFIQDAFLLIANYFLFIFCTRNSARLIYTSRALFYIFLMAFGITSFIYTFFLFDLLNFPINLFGITGETISFFLEYFMNVKLVIALLAVAGLIIASSYFLMPNLRLKKLPSVFGLLLTMLFIPTILRSSINPILYSFQEQIALSFATSENISKLTAPVADNSMAEQFHFLDKAFKTIPTVDINYDRVVVLAMEGISFNEFTGKSQADANSFLNRHKKNILSFANYHTLNLDSYTSLISMLNSIFIPYRAYVNEQKYSFVNNRNNLVRFFNTNGFSTYFLTSYGEQQERFAPNITEWTQAKFMENIGENAKNACITTSKIEYACEDLAVFDDLMRMLKNNRRAFVFQEMVYGHTAAWSEITGIETTDYYNRYFNKVVDALEKNNILDSTLLVITSDHGPRDDAYNRDNYHIPLMVFASDLQESSNNDFLSHLDFKDLLLALIANRKFEPGQKPIYTVGNSGEFVYGMITAEGNHVFINNRMRHVRGDASKAEIQSLNKNFQNYLSYFESLKLPDTEIEDFLLDKLSQHRILAIPECLSHDSYDAVRLPLNMIKRWSENDHGINKIIVGLETETDSRDFDLIQANKFHQSKRYATICPPGWGLHSTRKLNEYLFFKEIAEKLPARFEIFGFENSYHYYDKVRGKYVLPTEIDSVAQLRRIPNLESKAPMIVKYIYSKFFRDYRSFSTIREKIQANPEAHFLIIIGNAHTLKEMYFNETDKQIIQAYKIDTLKYCHPVGYFLKEHYSPLFIQSNTDTAIDASSLFEYDPANPDTVRFERFKYFFTDYIYSIPETGKTNVEEPPLLCIPSATNLSLLENKHFDLYQSEEFVAIAQKLIYFMTGVTPKIEIKNPGQALPCTFLDPKTNAPMDFGKYQTAITRWYADGAYIKRLREDLAAYNHRSLFKGIFRMMGKTDFSALSDSEAQTFIDYLLAALSVIGTEEEQGVARKHLSRKWGAVDDHYGYFKKYYFEKYASRKEE